MYRLSIQSSKAPPARTLVPGLHAGGFEAANASPEKISLVQFLDVSGHDGETGEICDGPDEIRQKLIMCSLTYLLHILV